MAKLDEHPTVVRHRQGPKSDAAGVLDAERLRRLCLDAGADDVGFVAIGRPELDDQRDDILGLYPWTKALISIVCRMNREPVRSPARSVANLEFHHTGDHTNEVARTIVAALEAEGVRAVNPAMGFPMEMDRFPGKIWVVAHKPVAVAAGLGQMGIHRNVIHPKFGNFILLATILIDAEISEQSRPHRLQPVPGVQALRGGLPGGGDRAGRPLRLLGLLHAQLPGVPGRVRRLGRDRSPTARTPSTTAAGSSDTETASMWQSLGFGPNYKAAYCMAVCPAGEDVIGPFLDDRKGFLKEVVDPLQEKEEPLYVVPGSDAEAHATKRFPHKRTKRVGSGLRPSSIRSFLCDPAARLPAAPLRGAGADLPLHVHRGGARRGDRRDPGQDDPGRGGHVGHARPARHGRQPDLAGVPAEGAEPRLGAAAAEDPPEGLAPAARGLRQVLPVLRRRGAGRIATGPKAMPPMSKVMDRAASTRPAPAGPTGACGERTRSINPSVIPQPLGVVPFAGWRAGLRGTGGSRGRPPHSRSGADGPRTPRQRARRSVVPHDFGVEDISPFAAPGQRLIAAPGCAALGFDDAPRAASS